MSRPTQVLAATPAARTSVSPTHPSTATLKIAKYDPTNKHDAVACPDLNSPYRGIAQPTVDPGHQLPLKTSHASYSCHHPFRSGTRPLACLAQGCMNLAHAARRCSRPTAPPDQWRCLHHRNITETVAGVPASALTPREHPRNQPRITCEAAAARLLPTSGRSSATTAAPPTTAPAPASPATQPTPLPTQATGRALGALPLLHLHPPILFQAVLLLNQNTIKAGKYYGYCSGTQTVSQQNSMS